MGSLVIKIVSFIRAANTAEISRKREFLTGDRRLSQGWPYREEYRPIPILGINYARKAGTRLAAPAFLAYILAITSVALRKKIRV